MKQIVSISLGPSSKDYEFETEFLGQNFNIKRFGADGDMDKAARMLLAWDNNADALGLANMRFPKTIGPMHSAQKHAEKLKKLSSTIQTNVTM